MLHMHAGCAAAQADRKGGYAQAAEEQGAAGAMAVQQVVSQIDFSNWNPVLDLPGYKPYPAVISLTIDCPIAGTPFKELAMAHLTARPPRAYFVVMLRDTNDSIAICDAEEGHAWLQKEFINPLTRQTVVKVDYFVTTQNPTFKHCFQHNGQGIDEAMDLRVKRHSIDNSDEAHRARLKFLESHSELALKAKNAEERKSLDNEFITVAGIILSEETRRNDHDRVYELIYGFLQKQEHLQERAAVVERLLGDNPFIQEKLGLSYFGIDWEKAEVHFRKAASNKDSTLIKSMIAIGTCLGQRGLIPEAIDHLSKIKEKHSNHSSISFVDIELAVLYAKLNNLQEALKLGKAAYDKFNKENWFSATLLSVIFSKTSDFPIAWFYAKEAQKLEPNNIDALVTLANCVKREGNIIAAGCFFKGAFERLKTIQFKGHFGEPYLEESYGEFLRIKGNLAEAKKFLQSALMKYGKYPSSEVYEYLGRLALDEKDAKRARECLERCVELNPENGRTHTLLGSVLVKNGDLRLAKVHLQKAMDLKYRHGDLYHTLGQIYEQEGDLPKACDAYEEAVKLDKNPEYFQRLGEVYERLGDLTKAQAAVETALKINDQAKPDDKLHAQLGRILKKKGDLNNAEKHLNRAIEINAANGAALKCLEELYVEKAKVLTQRRLQLQQGKTVAGDVAKAVLHPAADVKERAAAAAAPVAAADAKEGAARAVGKTRNGVPYPGKGGHFKIVQLADHDQDGEKKVFQCDNKDSFIQEIEMKKKYFFSIKYIELKLKDNLTSEEVNNLERYFSVSFVVNKEGNKISVLSLMLDHKKMLEILLENNTFEEPVRRKLEYAASTGEWPW